MAIWTQSGCANLHINICLQPGLSSGESGGGAGNGDWGEREQVGQDGGGLEGACGSSQQRQPGREPVEERGSTGAQKVQSMIKTHSNTGFGPLLVPGGPQGQLGVMQRQRCCRSLSSESVLVLTNDRVSVIGEVSGYITGQFGWAEWLLLSHPQKRHLLG